MQYKIARNVMLYIIKYFRYMVHMYMQFSISIYWVYFYFHVIINVCRWPFVIMDESEYLYGIGDILHDVNQSIPNNSPSSPPPLPPLLSSLPTKDSPPPPILVEIYENILRDTITQKYQCVIGKNKLDSKYRQCLDPCCTFYIFYANRNW